MVLHASYIPDLGLSDNHLFRIWEDYMRSQHYKKDGTVQEAVC